MAWLQILILRKVLTNIDYFRNYLNLKIRQLAMVTAFDTTFKDTLIDFEKEIIKILKK